MEERNNKSNTMLLTVIAIATLLVAVIGATFAYFTASIDTAETQSTVLLQGTTLTIAFSDNDDPQIVVAESLTPKKDKTSIASKSFSLTATNPSTATVNYSLYLVVTENSFALEDAAGKTSLTYSLTRTSNTETQKGEADNVTKANIPVYNLANLPKGSTYGTANPTTKGTYQNANNIAGGYAKLQATQMVNNPTYTHRLHNDLQNRALGGGTEQGLEVNGIKIGTGSISPANVDATNKTLTHSYRLDIFFDENALNQDYDKDSVFSGYVAIDADAITPAEA